jgi:hypothetical protein
MVCDGANPYMASNVRKIASVGVVPHTKKRWMALSIPNTVAIGDGRNIQIGSTMNHPNMYPNIVVDRFVCFVIAVVVTHLLSGGGGGIMM